MPNERIIDNDELQFIPDALSDPFQVSALGDYVEDMEQQFQIKIPF